MTFKWIDSVPIPIMKESDWFGGQTRLSSHSFIFFTKQGIFLHIGKSGGHITDFGPEILTEAYWDWFKTLETLFKLVLCMK